MEHKIPQIRMDSQPDENKERPLSNIQHQLSRSTPLEDHRSSVTIHGSTKKALVVRPSPLMLHPLMEERSPTEACFPGVYGEPKSPSYSVDRLSVTFCSDVASTGDSSSRSSMTSAKLSMNESKNNSPVMLADSTRVRFSNKFLALRSPDDDDEDDDYTASIDALLRRRDSKRRGSTRRSPIRRVSSPFSIDSERYRRRSSTVTTTSGETQMSVDDQEIPEEEIFENIRMHKEVIENVKTQAWRTQKKLKVIRQAKIYVKKHEGLLEQRLAQSRSTKDIMARYKIVFLRNWARVQREAVNIAALMVPWEQRIKKIECQFGSAVASYFTFLRWIFWINIIMTIMMACFIIIPEVLAGDRLNAGDRKELLPDEVPTAFNLQTLWDFEGWLKYSPIFYGYYSNTDETKEGYRIPFAYFMTSIGLYVYSFWAILQKMAENSRMSKISDKDEECTFTWKLFSGWDYMIGNSETSQNKVASIIMGFKETILEEQEKSKEGRNWKIIALRVLANFLVLALLSSSAYAVVLVVERSQQPEAESSWWRQNEVTVVVSLITALFPNFFEIIGLMENYHPRNALQWQLSRIMILNMLNVYTLNFALFDKISKMSLELNQLKPNTTIAPPTPFSTMSTVFFNTSTWNMTYSTPFLQNENVIFRYINTSARLFNLTGMDPNCTVIPVECNLFQSEVTVPAVLMQNFTQFTELMQPNVTFEGSNASDIYQWVSNYDFNSTIVSLFTNVTDFLNLTLPSVDDSTSLSFNTTISVFISNSSIDTIVPLNDLDIGVVLHPNFKAMSLIFLPPELLAKFNLTNTSTNASDYLHFNSSDYGITFSTLLNEWITGTPFPSTSIDPESNLTLMFTSSMVSENVDEDFQTTTVLSIPLNASYWSMLETTSVAPECFAIWCPNDTDFAFDVLEPTDYEIMKPTESMRTVSPTTMQSATLYELDNILVSTSSCQEENCSASTTPSELVVPTLLINGVEVDMETRLQLRKLCWETMFGQEIVKITIMDLVITIIMSLIMDSFRAVFVRVMNRCWCWDLEKQFPGYGDFKIAENILHLVNNQGMIWMGTFFSPGLPGINLFKLFTIMYLRSWTVLTCNVPHETVFKASRSNNFYFMLLLAMLFLCSLPVAYAVVWIEPSWHCGPFSQYARIYRILTTSVTRVMPGVVNRALDYFTSPSIVIPLLVLLTLVIYYLLSLSQSLREANDDLKSQLRRERLEERKKSQEAGQDGKDGFNGGKSKWPTVMKKILPVLPNRISPSDEDIENQTQDIKQQDKDYINNGPMSNNTKLIHLSDEESAFNETDQEVSSLVYTDETKLPDMIRKDSLDTKPGNVPVITISQANGGASKKDKDIEDVIAVDQRIPLLKESEDENLEDTKTKRKKAEKEKFKTKKEKSFDNAKGTDEIFDQTETDTETNKKKKQKDKHKKVEEKHEAEMDDDKSNKENKTKEENKSKKENKKIKEKSMKKDKNKEKGEIDVVEKEKESEKNSDIKDTSGKAAEKEKTKKGWFKSKKPKVEKDVKECDKETLQKLGNEESKSEKAHKGKHKEEKKADKTGTTEQKQEGKQTKKDKKLEKEKNKQRLKKLNSKDKEELIEEDVDDGQSISKHDYENMENGKLAERDKKKLEKNTKQKKDLDKSRKKQKVDLDTKEKSTETCSVELKKNAEENSNGGSRKQRKDKFASKSNELDNNGNSNPHGDENFDTLKNKHDDLPKVHNKKSNLKGEGMFQSDVTPLMDDPGTPSSISSTRTYEVTSPLNNASFTEQDCDVSEVTVVLDDQQKCFEDENESHDA